MTNYVNRSEMTPTSTAQDDVFWDQFAEPTNANMFDHFDEPQTPKFALRATREINTPTVFDFENQQLREPIYPSQIEAVSRTAPQQGLADFLAPVMDRAELWLSPLGFSWDNARQAQQEMQQMPWLEQAATNLAGIDTGMAKLGDALINLPAGLIQQGAGVPAQEGWRSDMQGAIENWAPVHARKEAAPHAFNVAEGVGGLAAPVPMLGPAPIFKGWQAAVKAGNPLASVLNMMGGGAVTAGAIGGGEAVKQNRQIEPMNVFAPALAGGLTSGVLSGGILGMAKAGQALAAMTADKASKAHKHLAQASQAAVNETMHRYNQLTRKERKEFITRDSQDVELANQFLAIPSIEKTKAVPVTSNLPIVTARQTIVTAKAEPKLPADMLEQAQREFNEGFSSTPIVGDFRRTLNPEFYGRNKNRLAASIDGHPVYDKADVRRAITTIANAKAKLDYAEALHNRFEKGVWEKFAPEDAESLTLSNGIVLRLAEETPPHQAWHQHMIDQARSEFETGVEKSAGKSTWSALLSQKFGRSSQDAKIHHFQIPDSEPEAAKKLLELQRAAESAKQEYDSLRLVKVDERLADLERMIEKKYEGKKPNLALIDKLNAEKQKLEDAREIAAYIDTVLRKAEMENQTHTGDAFQHLHVKTQVRHPLNPNYKGIEVGVEFRNSVWKKVVPPEHQNAWNERRRELERLDLNRVPRMTIKGNYRSAE